MNDLVAINQALLALEMAESKLDFEFDKQQCRMAMRELRRMALRIQARELQANEPLS